MYVRRSGGEIVSGENRKLSTFILKINEIILGKKTIITKWLFLSQNKSDESF